MMDIAEAVLDLVIICLESPRPWIALPVIATIVVVGIAIALYERRRINARPVRRAR